MTEQFVEGVVSAEVDAERQRIVQKGPLGAETSAVPPEPVNLTWKKRGQGRLIGEHPKTLAERISEAYTDGLEPGEKELLDHAAEQFGRRLTNEE
jgi:hypothetical protein